MTTPASTRSHVIRISRVIALLTQRGIPATTAPDRMDSVTLYVGEQYEVPGSYDPTLVACQGGQSEPVGPEFRYPLLVGPGAFLNPHSNLMVFRPGDVDQPVFVERDDCGGSDPLWVAPPATTTNDLVAAIVSAYGRVQQENPGQQATGA